MSDGPKISADYPDETALIVDGTRIEQFGNESILFSIDQVGAGFSFECPFYPETKKYRELFKPFGYQDVAFYIGGNLVLSGIIESISPKYDTTKTAVACQGRSKTGIIVDCTFEQDDFNGKKYLENGLQFKNQTLDKIASAVVAKFGLSVSFSDDPGPSFERVAPENVTTTIFDFLQNLARQRGLLMAQTETGELLFRKANTSGKPVAELIEGHHGVIMSGASYDGTKRFSEYNAFGQTYDTNGNFALVEDKSVPILRPKSIQANDTNSANIYQSAEWALSADIASSINIPLGYEGWLTPDGSLWKENQLIIVHAPSLMIYRPSVMLIKSVTLSGTPSSKKTEFTLTIPEAYTGKIPEAFPWE